jgi:hypothetical protein
LNSSTANANGEQSRDGQSASNKDGKQKAFSTDHVNIQDRDKASNSSLSVMRNTEKYLGANSTKHQHHSTINDKGMLDSENVFIEDILVNKHRENEREIKRERRY